MWKYIHNTPSSPWKLGRALHDTPSTHDFADGPRESPRRTRNGPNAHGFQQVHPLRAGLTEK